MSDNEKCPNCQWNMWLGKCLMCGYENHEPLRTTPQREWQGLTDEDFDEYCKTLHPLWNTCISRTEAEAFFRAGAAKLKEKNA